MGFSRSSDDGSGGPAPGTAAAAPAWSRRLELILSVYAVAVLTIAWIGVVLALILDPDLPESAWTWLTDAAVPVQVLLWVLLLPITLGLWIWTSDFPTVVLLAYGLGLAMWTLTAVRSLWKAVRPR